MKPAIWLCVFSLLFVIFSCNSTGERSTTGAATDSSAAIADSSAAIAESSGASRSYVTSILRSREVLAKFSHGEIMQELINRGVLKLEKNDYRRLYLRRDTIPWLKQTIPFVHRPNSLLATYNTDEVYMAYITGYAQKIDVLYNPDSSDKNRLPYESIEAVPYRRYANKVLGVIQKFTVTSADANYVIKGGQTVNDLANKASKAELCTNQKFANQPAAMLGTAFAIDNRTLITAGHVIDHDGPCSAELLQDYLADLYFVAGNEYTQSAASTGNVLSGKNVYRGIGIINRPFGLDISIVRLDRPLPDSLVTDMATAIPQPQSRLFMPGFPSGMPKFITVNGIMRDANYTVDSVNFYVKIDAFQGNSGSPLYDETTHRVFGILVSGNPDFDVKDNLLQCCRYYTCHSIAIIADPGLHVCNGETVINLVRIYPQIKELIAKSPQMGMTCK